MAPQNPDISRIIFITQKRVSLEKQLITLEYIISDLSIDHVQARLPLARLTSLLHSYEELHDELSLIDPQNEGLTLLDNIQKKFYEIAGPIANLNLLGVELSFRPFLTEKGHLLWKMDTR